MKIEAYSPTIRRKEMDAVLTTMVGERVGPGEISVRLLQIAQEYIGFESAIGLRSPETALRLALGALDLEPGSEVVLSALSPAYYAYVLEALKLKAVYCDVDESSGAVTQESVRKAIGEKARAVIVHHSLGIVPDVAAIIELGLPVIEDCSRSYGSNWQDRRAGSFGVFTILGLEERDILTAGGGALLYASGKRESTVLKRYGDLPMEYRLPDMNAALATVQFKEAERNFEKRKEIASIYTQSSLRTRHRRLAQIGDAEYNYYAFPLVLDTGAKDARIYSVKKEVFAEMAFEDSVVQKRPLEHQACPVAVSLALRTLVFPLYP
ncbi:MAG: aminotransferase DegT, partial [Treponema sp. GWA1_62_8]